MTLGVYNTVSANKTQKHMKLNREAYNGSTSCNRASNEATSVQITVCSCMAPSVDRSLDITIKFLTIQIRWEIQLNVELSLLTAI